MKEHIEREALLELYQIDGPENETGHVPLPVIRQNIMDLPAADVAEVRHGRWEFLGPNRLIKSCMCGTCSVCHVRSVYIVNTAICPNCGARMDKEGDQ